jgi:homoserine kinase type II
LQSADIEPSVEIGIKEILHRWYDLGTPVDMKQILGGYINNSYAVWLEKRGKQTLYLLRQYNPSIAEKEIRFEHALIRHLRGNGFTLAADVMSCRDGGTFIRTADDKGVSATYWGLFEFLSGEDKYSWTRTDLTAAEVISSAETLARLHHAGRDFRPPPGAERAQPRIMDLLAIFPSTFKGFARQARDRRSDRLFLDHLDSILSKIQQCLTIKKELSGLLELPIHCDYHPGNLKFQDYRVVGLFDFDWSKIDYRLFDVALALVYFMSVWPGEAAGSMRLDKSELFLKNYNDQCRKLDGIPSLSSAEAQCLVSMLATANLFVLNWDLTDIYAKTDLDDEEYFTYIDHNLRTMHWIDTHVQNLEAAIRQACSGD